MDLNYGTSTYDRTRGNFPVLPVINMFVEDSLSETEQPVLVSRPGLGLLPSPTLGAGSSPVKTHGMFYTQGVLNSDVWIVTGDNTLYKTTVPNPTNTITSIGTINGTGPVSWGAYSSNVFLTSGISIWTYDGATLSAISTPGGFSTKALCVGASRLIVINAGTGKFYWSDPLGVTVPTLNFATAENSPDSLLDCLYVGDTLYLFGNETVELWPVTTDPNAPFQPLVGRTFTKGIRDTGCCTPFAGMFAWITNRNEVCVGDPDAVISHPGIEEKLALSASASLYNFWIEATEFLAVKTATQTFVYSAKSKQWSEFQTNGANWDVAAYANGIFGNAASGTLQTWFTEANSSGAYVEGSSFERRFRLGAPITRGMLRADNVTLRVNEGYTPTYSIGKPSEFQNPTVQLRTSNDGGNTWTSYQSVSLGVNGSYRVPPTWRSLGIFGFPGFLAEVRVTDRVPFRVSGAKLNEPYGTR